MVFVFLNSILASDNRNKRAFEFEIMTFNNINNMFYFFSFSEENSEVDVWDGWFSRGDYLYLLPSFIYSESFISMQMFVWHSNWGRGGETHNMFFAWQKIYLYLKIQIQISMSASPPPQPPLDQTLPLICSTLKCFKDICCLEVFLYQRKYDWVCAIGAAFECIMLGIIN